MANIKPKTPSFVKNPKVEKAPAIDKQPEVLSGFQFQYMTHKDPENNIHMVILAKSIPMLSFLAKPNQTTELKFIYYDGIRSPAECWCSFANLLPDVINIPECLVHHLDALFDESNSGCLVGQYTIRNTQTRHKPSEVGSVLTQLVRLSRIQKNISL